MMTRLDRGSAELTLPERYRRFLAELSTAGFSGDIAANTADLQRIARLLGINRIAMSCLRLWGGTDHQAASRQPDNLDIRSIRHSRHPE
ncbi:hypothetical protein AAGT95_06525 [Salinicola lusitanus]|uniref:Uncharacterized protein n=1 Tax=Salinicola lusitanus TaxID=1949085 RepID=A0ABZ3CWK9_9GAMM